MNTFIKLEESYLSQLELRKESCLSKAGQLRQDNKDDEANFEKVKANIYDVFKSIFIACKKKVYSNNKVSESEKLEQFANEYLASFQRIPSSWRVKLEYAIANHLLEERILEESKLEVAKSLRELFITMKEGYYDRRTSDSTI